MGELFSRKILKYQNSVFETAYTRSTALRQYLIHGVHFSGIAPASATLFLPVKNLYTKRVSQPVLITARFQILPCPHQNHAGALTRIKSLWLHPFFPKPTPRKKKMKRLQSFLYPLILILVQPLPRLLRIMEMIFSKSLK